MNPSSENSSGAVPQETSPSASRPWLVHGLRFLVGGAFLFAGILKIMGPAKFAIDVANYRLVPHDMINLVAVLLPWIEVTAGVFVLAGVWLQPAAVVITFLTGTFLIAILSALARGLNIECGCFGTVGGRHVGLVNLLIDSTLLLLSVLLLRRSGKCVPGDGAGTAVHRHFKDPSEERDEKRRRTVDARIQ
ncbi:MAG TPA: MauE/DoxX family redox-associated membrane protein [Roseimicrobium sp.]|nr:MauE/DoxX family redox-associated membrane protein [Roseimicrobium sp.]